MMPSAYILMDEFPLTANGKIDKKALPEPDGTLLQAEYVAPETETEKVLVSIWAKLLKVEEDKLSVTANFFELGGHSLLLIKMITQIKHLLLLEPQIKTVFGVKNILELADYIENGLLINESNKKLKNIEIESGWI
jgi:acyl carrier protein